MRRLGQRLSLQTVREASLISQSLSKWPCPRRSSYRPSQTGRVLYWALRCTGECCICVGVYQYSECSYAFDEYQMNRSLGLDSDDYASSHVSRGITSER